MRAMRLLIADDDVEMRSWLRAVLVQQYAAVEEAASGAELVRAFAEEGPYHLVITDVRMPWASGTQALSMARLAGYRTPFLVITAYADARVRAAAQELCAAVLEKPFTAEKLLEAVRVTIEQGDRAVAG